MYDKYTKADSCWNWLNSEDPLMAKLSKFDSHAAVAMQFVFGFFHVRRRVFRSLWLAEPSEHTWDFAARFGLQEVLGAQLATTLEH